jgi:hypothetical protein
VPTTLSPDGRSRPPHLRSWRDGWRHLKFLLLFSPRWLFIYPGTLLAVFGLVAFAVLLPGYQVVGHVRFGVHTLLFAGAAILIGVQLMSFGLLASVFGARENYWLGGGRIERLRRFLSVDRGCILGGLMILAGIAGAAFAFLRWSAAGYGDMQVESLMRITIPAVLLCAVALQLIFTTFLLELMSHPRRPGE